MKTLKLGAIGIVLTVAMLGMSPADARGRHHFPGIKVIVNNTPGVTIENESPIPVTIQNGGSGGSAQPFCPCFTTEEIEAELAGPATECIDDRVLDESLGSITRMDSINALAGVSGRFNPASGYSYSCSLGRIGMDVDFVVSFRDIGFTNMAACRLTIINSPSWETCPTVQR